MALAVRALGRGEGGAVDPRAVLTMVERVMREGDVRRGAVGADLGPDDARGLLHAWLEAIDLRLGEGDLLALLQHEDFSHADLFRRARRAHERKLAGAVDASWPPRPAAATSARPRQASSTPASRPSHTRPRPPSSAARRASSSSAKATRCASRSWPTPSAACTA
jgi:hypothetical protein